MVNTFVKGTLAWPMAECLGCGYNLREATPAAREPANDVSDRLTWNDFCPRCGRGYVVGTRTLPLPNEEEVARRAKAPVIDKTPIEGLEAFDPEHQVTAGPVATSEPSLIPPDQRGAELANATDQENPDPEGQLGQEPQEESRQPEGTPDPDAIKAPGEGQFFCTKCAANHNETSGIGKRHSKHREV